MNRLEPKLSPVSWSTADEINFIRGLGAHMERRKTPRAYHEALKKYREAMHARERWGTIDKIAVEIEVNRLIEKSAYLELVEI